MHMDKPLKLTICFLRIYSLFIFAKPLMCYNVSVKTDCTHKGGIVMTDNINKTPENEELDLDQLEDVSGGYTPPLSTKRICSKCGQETTKYFKTCQKCGYDFNNKTYNGHI